MEIFNAAKHTVADVFTATDKEGREHLVIVIKATYRIPDNNKHPRPLLPPQPLIESDIYAGEPGYSAVLYEADYVRYKIKCDVLFNAKTYFTATHNKYQKNIRAIVSTIDKTLTATGPRYWKQKIQSGLFQILNMLMRFHYIMVMHLVENISGRIVRETNKEIYSSIIL